MSDFWKKESYSPTRRTEMTETIMAIYDVLIRSKRTGRDSFASALANNKVTNKRFWFFTKGMILSAYFFSLGVPDRWKISKFIISTESKPIVRPETIPANKIRKILTHK